MTPGCNISNAFGGLGILSLSSAVPTLGLLLGDISNLSDELQSEEALRLEKDALVLDVRGQICPDPQIAAKIALEGLESGKLVVIYTDHVDATANVPNGVKALVSKVRIWKLRRGEYKIFLWKK
jgi:TusA-related sulfurtransferase